jgi:hypothetical protein
MAATVDSSVVIVLLAFVPNDTALTAANYCWALQLGEFAWLLRDGPEAKQHEADHRERQNSW